MDMKSLAALCGVAFALGAVGSTCELDDDGETVRIRRVGEKAAFAEFRRGERSANCDIAVRTEKGSPFVFIDVTPRIGKVSTVWLPRISLRGIDPKTWKAMGTGGLADLDRRTGSYAFCALGEVKTRRGYVAAWLTDEWASGSVHFDSKGVTGKAEYGPMRVAPGDAPRTDTFVVGAFDDCRLGLEAYADAVAARYGIRLMPQISGFCTWYSDVGGYTTNKAAFAKGACSEGLTREFVDAAQGLAKWGFGYYQIDDRWQDGAERLGPAMVFSRVNPKGPYPGGMKPTADYIGANGFVAGLWYMPFSGDTKDPWWQDKADLFVKSAVTSPANDGVGPRHLAQKRGEPYVTPFGSGALDMSNPKAIEYVRNLASLVTRDWGFRMIKFDGMYSGMAADLGFGRTYGEEALDRVVFSDPGMSNVQAFRRGLRAMRDGCADGTRLLACNVAQNARGIAASYGLVDLLRIGGDNGPIDCFPERYMAGPIAGSPRYFLNGRVWYSDPDPVYVRDAVPLGRARLMASWTSLGGLLYNFSDWLPSLSDGRVEILKRTMAPHGHARQVRPVDYFERTVQNVWKLTDGDRAVFGLYNWGTNGTLRVDYPAAYCDLDPSKTYVGFDFWRDEFVAPFKGRFSFDVPKDDCRVIAVRELIDRPFVISTSRHVASPIIDVAEERWDPSTKTLSGVSTAVPGEPYELRIVVDGAIRRVKYENAESPFRWEVSFR